MPVAALLAAALVWNSIAKRLPLMSFSRFRIASLTLGGLGGVERAEADQRNVFAVLQRLRYRPHRLLRRLPTWRPNAKGSL